jgi:carbonic anhydrase
VDVDALLPKNSIRYRYEGSLTTPPCSKDVQWIVMATPIQMSAEQIGMFPNLVKGNNRPVQPLNNRTAVTDQVTEKLR